MVEQTWNFFVESTEIDDLEKIDLTQVFVSSDYSINDSLVQHIVQAPEYVQQEQRGPETRAIVGNHSSDEQHGR